LFAYFFTRFYIKKLTLPATSTLFPYTTLFRSSLMISNQMVQLYNYGMAHLLKNYFYIVMNLMRISISIIIVHANIINGCNKITSSVIPEPLWNISSLRFHNNTHTY